MTLKTRVITYGALGLSAVCLMPLAARAQLGGGPGAQFYHFSIGLAGGLTIPTGNAIAPIKTGFNGQGYVLIRLLPGLPVLRFNLGYSRSSFQSSQDQTQTLNPFGKTREVLSGVGGLTLNLFHIGPVSPYLTAGIGAFNVRTSTDTGSTSTGSTTTTTGTTQSTFNFGIDGGAGLAFALGRVSAFAEGRVQNVYTQGGGLIKGAKQIQAVPVSFGLAVGVF